jgi:hypothetical protein
VIKHVPMDVSTQCVTTPPPVAVQVTATLALPGGPRQLFNAPRAVAPGETAALAFGLVGLPDRVDAVVTAVVTVVSAETGRVQPRW